MEALFYSTGLIVWLLLSVVVTLITVYFLWTYLSIALSYWWVRIKAESLNPESETVKKKFKGKSFWRTRLLLMALADVKMIIHFNGATLHGDCWGADYTGFIPKVNVWKIK